MPEIAKCLVRGNQRLDPETETLIPIFGGGFSAVSFNFHKSGNEGSSLGVVEDRTDCLRADSKSPFAIAFDCKASGQAGFGVGDIASTMRSMGHSNSHQNGGGHQAVMTGMQVRRLTPVECERLQGFPDNYTNVPHRGKPAADGPRYKALGNSMAVPVMAWIGQRIQAVEGLQQSTKQAA